MKVSRRLRSCFTDVLIKFSDKHPNQVVNPKLITCFVMTEFDGKILYYPVTGIKKVQKRNEARNLCNFAEISVTPYSFCQNPIGVISDITGADILELDSEEDSGEVYADNLYCPQFNAQLKIAWGDNSKAHEGIMVFSIR